MDLQITIYCKDLDEAKEKLEAATDAIEDFANTCESGEILYTDFGEVEAT